MNQLSGAEALVRMLELHRVRHRQMTTGRPGAAHLGLPFDVQKQPVDVVTQPLHEAHAPVSERVA